MKIVELTPTSTAKISATYLACGVVTTVRNQESKCRSPIKLGKSCCAKGHDEDKVCDRHGYGLIYVLQESVIPGFHFGGTIRDPNDENALLDFDTWDVSVLVLCA